jgi:hypothetical protein
MSFKHRATMMKEIDYFLLPLTEATVKWDTQGAYAITRSNVFCTIGIFLS